MARTDFPLCVYCNSDANWLIVPDNNQIAYSCGNCGNTIIVESNND